MTNTLDNKITLRTRDLSTFDRAYVFVVYDLERSIFELHISRYTYCQRGIARGSRLMLSTCLLRRRVGPFTHDFPACTLAYSFAGIDNRNAMAFLSTRVPARDEVALAIFAGLQTAHKE